MARKKELTLAEKNEIFKKIAQGMSMLEISKRLKCIILNSSVWISTPTNTLS